ncbi:hypothetical protein CCHR01_03304 [Colletotrichum chrysophilum]|uniref:Uncharacterized protein n=1 Tax=Colletotrichum chrysophilum TaxID=1836956 RepID=A0AAD9AT84_9PEZI|nr:hypothetical protein CCHR01_03304 [Colletotrichum chrysophilum]
MKMPKAGHQPGGRDVPTTDLNTSPHHHRLRRRHQPGASRSHETTLHPAFELLRGLLLESQVAFRIDDNSPLL